MPLSRLLPLAALILLSGCVYHVREQVDHIQCDLALHPYDLAPPGQAEPPKSDTPVKGPPLAPLPPGQDQGAQPAAPTDVQTTAFLQAAEPEKPGIAADKAAQRLEVPGVIPGSETARIDFTRMTEAQIRETIGKLYPDLPPLEPEPVAQPGPGGRPYTLADLQALAAQYSPTLEQAVAGVKAAQGNLLQARAYPNPTIAYEADPSSTGLSPNFQGFYIDQPIKTAGKLKLQEAAARKDLENAELALRRARSDLSTQVRNAYFGVLVARETVRVNRGVARLTDEVYRIQRELATERIAASYEPATLGAQAELARLAYRQSIFVYQAAWRQVVTAVGLRQRDLPLSEVAGRPDASVPIYDYDKVLAQVLSRHTDVLTARNGIEKVRYNLELARITPWFQDMDVQVKVQRDFSVPPGQFVPSVILSMPLSVWDQNKGNIIAQEAALAQALDQPHAAELSLTSTLTTAFSNYRQNLRALEDYRQTILPNQVRAYRGVFERRRELGAQGKTPVAFADLVTAQQALTTSVTAYLAILGQLWTSVTSVADLLQTDDLFQVGRPEALPPVPDLDHLLPLPCGHDCPAPAAAPGVGCAPGPVPAPPRADGWHAAESAEKAPGRFPLRVGGGADTPAPASPAPAFVPAVGMGNSSEPRPGGSGR